MENLDVPGIKYIKIIVYCAVMIGLIGIFIDSNVSLLSIWISVGVFDMCMAYIIIYIFMKGKAREFSKYIFYEILLAIILTGVAIYVSVNHLFIA